MARGYLDVGAGEVHLGGKVLLENETNCTPFQDGG